MIPLGFCKYKASNYCFSLKKILVIFASECWTIAIKLQSFLGCILLCIKNNSDLRFLGPVKINVKAADPPPCPSLSNTLQEQNSVFPSALHIFHPKDRRFFQIHSRYGHSRGEPSAQPKALSTSDNCNKDLGDTVSVSIYAVISRNSSHYVPYASILLLFNVIPICVHLREPSARSTLLSCCWYSADFSCLVFFTVRHLTQKTQRSTN